MTGWITSEELDRLATQIAEEGRKLLENLEVEENRRKWPEAKAEVRRKHELEQKPAEKKIEPEQKPEKKKGIAQGVPIMHWEMKRFMRSLHQGDRILYRMGKPWGKPVEGTVIKAFRHVALIKDGGGIRTVMSFDILKCELNFYDDGYYARKRRNKR